jgi:hypothetical protein
VPTDDERQAKRESNRASLRVAALGFAATVALTSAVAIRDDIEGRPFGVQIPLSVRAGILTGWGAGIAAPWPMVVVAVIAASRARQNAGSPWPGQTYVALGLAGIVGLLVEPNTYRPKSWSRAARVSIAMDLAAKSVLVFAGLRQLRALSTHRSHVR